MFVMPICVRNSSAVGHDLSSGGQPGFNSLCIAVGPHILKHACTAGLDGATNTELFHIDYGRVQTGSVAYAEPHEIH